MPSHIDKIRELKKSPSNDSINSSIDCDCIIPSRPPERLSNRPPNHSSFNYIQARPLSGSWNKSLMPRTPMFPSLDHNDQDLEIEKKEKKCLLISKVELDVDFLLGKKQSELKK